MPIRNVGSEMPTSDSAWNSLASALSRLQGGVDAHRDARHQRQDRGDERELERRRHARADQIGDRLLELIGDAEIETRRIAEKAHAWTITGWSRPS